METVECLVYFKDLLEDNATPHFGILFENEFILCFCCGGYIEPKDYKILKKFDYLDYLDDTLKECFLTDEERGELSVKTDGKMSNYD